MSDRNATSSKFAWLTSPGLHAQPAHDIVVASNRHFIALPSLGSLVAGWVLVVPRRPMPTLSLMNTEERQSLAALREELAGRLVAYGRVVYAFEHGGAAGGLVSCGVDQAHLHLVPLDFDLIDVASRHDLGWRPSSGIHDLSEAETDGQEYLFVENDDVSMIGFPKTPISQWFRQLIALECGVEEWDYKRNPNLERLEATAVELTTSRGIISTLRS